MKRFALLLLLSSCVFVQDIYSFRGAQLLRVAHVSSVQFSQIMAGVGINAQARWGIGELGARAYYQILVAPTRSLAGNVPSNKNYIEILDARAKKGDAEDFLLYAFFITKCEQDNPGSTHVTWDDILEAFEKMSKVNKEAYRKMVASLLNS